MPMLMSNGQLVIGQWSMKKITNYIYTRSCPLGDSRYYWCESALVKLQCSTGGLQKSQFTTYFAPCCRTVFNTGFINMDNPVKILVQYQGGTKGQKVGKWVINHHKVFVTCIISSCRSSNSISRFSVVDILNITAWLLDVDRRPNILVWKCSDADRAFKKGATLRWSSVFSWYTI